MPIPEAYNSNPQNPAAARSIQELVTYRENVIANWPDRWLPPQDRWADIVEMETEPVSVYTGAPFTQSYKEEYKKRVQRPIRSELSKCIELMEQSRVFILSAPTGIAKSSEFVLCALNNLIVTDHELLRRIAILQPRREPCIKLAEYAAKCLDMVEGDMVGHRVRGSRTAAHHTMLQYVTDSWLWAQVNGNGEDILGRYYHIVIVDEAHEHSAPTRLLLEVIHQRLDQDPKFKAIIMSATLNGDAFEHYFAKFNPTRADITVTSPFRRDIFYEPTMPENDRDLFFRALNKVIQLMKAGKDVLVFIAGEDDIDEVRACFGEPRPGGRLADALGGPFDYHELYAQQKPSLRTQAVNSKWHPDRRRLLVATNIAETSLTIDGLDAVVDTGYMKVSYWDHDRDARALRREFVTQSSAEQRAGRVGRQEDGVVYRLYTLARHKGNRPDMAGTLTRERLTQYVLQTLAAGRPLQDRVLLEHPSDRAFETANQELFDLDMLDMSSQLTPMGRAAARCGCDPRIAAMLIASQNAGDRAPRLAVCLGAALELRNPRQLLKLRDHDAVLGFLYPLGDLEALAYIADECLTPAFEPVPSEGSARTKGLLAYLSENAKRLWRDYREATSPSRAALVRPLPIDTTQKDQILSYLVSVLCRRQMAEALGGGHEDYREMYTQSRCKLDRDSLVSFESLEMMRLSFERTRGRAWTGCPPDNYPYLWYYTKQIRVARLGHELILIDLYLRPDKDYV